MDRPLRVLVAGCGNMGASHARAYHRMPEFQIVGLVSRGPSSRRALGRELGGPPDFGDYHEALRVSRPDVVSINTYPETHGPFARAAIEAGCHVFGHMADAVNSLRIVLAADLSFRRGQVVTL